MNRILKKTGLLWGLILLSFQAISAQEIQWGSNYKPGNLVLGASGAFETSRVLPVGYAFGLYPTAEVLIWKPVVNGMAPVDFGLGAKARLGIPLNSYGDFSMGAAFLGSMHIGFRGLDFPYSEYLANLDLYAYFGFSFDFLHPDGMQFGTVATSGANYFFDEHFNLGLSYTGWGGGDTGVDGVAIHIRYRFGDRPAVEGTGDLWGQYQKRVEDLESMEPVSRFYSLFYYSIYSGGYYWNSDSYQEGTGTVWSYTDNGEESFEIERTLLERTDLGDWWSLRFSASDRAVEYEFFLSRDQNLEELYYTDEDGLPHKKILANTPELGYMGEKAVLDFQEIEEMSSHRETISVTAGTYSDCLLVEMDVDGQQYRWWFTDSSGVPGGMVKFSSENDRDVFTGELVDTIEGRSKDFRLRD